MGATVSFCSPLSPQVLSGEFLWIKSLFFQYLILPDDIPDTDRGPSARPDAAIAVADFSLSEIQSSFDDALQHATSNFVRAALRRSGRRCRGRVLSADGATAAAALLAVFDR